ncbi:uncharacterized protein LOC129587331 isoform X2 [Paramacrobiotus metropolitanus]|uniref:uncharacterized protein LOC129587331 isoform X2 n=1 Tax=Paramacrobiotus metropolitanus TaxID=2943436 RepID=UPI0024457E5D|nr:uncharacterized protein LOC129587331 isoform X2 [Paramacrobiotus metropolitanus]
MARVPIVLVRHPDSREEQWCLGFLRQTSGFGAEVSVDFRCERLAPRCFPLQALFPHVHPPHAGPVLVALRADRRRDPLTLQPASILSFCCFGQVQFALVQTPADGARHLVHRMQLVAPFHDSPGRSLWDRVHAGQGNVWGLDGHGSVDAGILDQPEVTFSASSASSAMPCGVSFAVMSLDMVEGILEHVDMQTRARLRRVSPAWNALLTTRPALRQHVTFDFRLRPASDSLAEDMFRLGRALFRCLTGDVQTLTLRHWTPGLARATFNRATADITVLGYILPLLVGGSVPRIVLQHCVVDHDLSSSWRMNRALEAVGIGAKDPVCIAWCGPLHRLGPLLALCRRLILRDYVMQDVFGSFGRGGTQRESHLYTFRGGTRRSVDVRLADLRLDSCRDRDATLDVVVQAVEVALAPAVSSDMSANVKVMLEYWRSLPLKDARCYWGVMKTILAVWVSCFSTFHLLYCFQSKKHGI